MPIEETPQAQAPILNSDRGAVLSWLRTQPECDSIATEPGDETCDVCRRVYEPDHVMLVEQTGIVCFHCLHNLAKAVLSGAL